MQNSFAALNDDDDVDMDESAAADDAPSVAADDHVGGSSASARARRLRDPLVWMDLEMSGLDPTRHHILEIAVIVTDGQLRNAVDGPNLVIKQPESVLEAMDDWNTEHHGQSGLIDRVRRSTVTLEAAEEAALTFVRGLCNEKGAQPAGACIFKDVQFIEAYMPRFARHLHHRTVDVSSVRELARRWFPNEFKARPSGVVAHRARDDIVYSIEEMRYFRRAVFKQHGGYTGPLNWCPADAFEPPPRRRAPRAAAESDAPPPSSSLPVPSALVHALDDAPPA